jgi:CheY-like chemotaxis protein
VTATNERRALVIDDDPGIRILVTRILVREGFIVDAARDGGEGLEKILQHDYDLIALDLMMPRIDGFAVVNYLVENRPEDLPKIIVMTAFGATARPKVMPPVTRFIEKPFDIDTFIATAGDVLRAPATPPPADDDASAEEHPSDSRPGDIPA